MDYSSTAHLEQDGLAATALLPNFFHQISIPPRLLISSLLKPSLIAHNQLNDIECLL